MARRKASLSAAVTLTFATVHALASNSDTDAPIVDVRFDGPYQQIEPSMGDEWAPTWGPDNVLYTGNNDGKSFGEMPSNTIAFGKLEGDDPYSLKGTLVNRMQEFREGQIAAEAAKWKVLDSYRIESVTYRFKPCGVGDDGLPHSCLVTSSKENETWADVTAKTALFHGTKFRSPTFIAFRKEYELFMGTSDRYAFAVAYVGTLNGEDSYIIGRVPAEKLSHLNTADWSFRTDNSTWSFDLNEAAPTPNSTGLGADGGNWKTTNSYSIDGTLYTFVTRCLYPSGSNDEKRRHIFQNSSIITSSDKGRTWKAPVKTMLRSPLFPGKRFGAPYFVWYGKDGAAEVDNADRYVYAISNNGHFENGDDYVIGRVLRKKLPELKSSDWSFYTDGDGREDASWSPRMNEAKPILTNPGHSGMTGVAYIPDLRRYVMVSWHYNRDNFEAGIAAGDLSTVLEFFEAPNPWGTWTKVKTFETGLLGWFAPVIGQRFQTKSDKDTVSVVLYSSGFRTTPSGSLDFSMYKLNYMPLSLSTTPLKHRDPKYVGGR